jgi:DNA-directed RNA polymerase specialized sigma24 family protein
MNIGEIENAESWLKRVSWNLAISRFRENSRQRNQDLESLDILYTHDTHEIERNESLEALNKKIGRLPPKYRDSILDVANGLTLSEIGRRQGVNSRTAASRLFTARGLAKRVLAES